MLEIEDIYAAKKRIYQLQNEWKEHIKHTGLLFSHWFLKQYGIKVYLKLENEQRMGSFKMRGALNALLSLYERGVLLNICAASAGNHAQGVAWAVNLINFVKHLNIRSYIVMPKYATPTKIEATKEYGAEVEIIDGSLHDAEIIAKEKAKEHGWFYISPYNDTEVMAGQGTVMLEILEEKENPDIKTVVIPIGGGGLFSGCAIATSHANQPITFYGVQAQKSPEMYNIINGTNYPIEQTIAGGLAGKIDHTSATIPIVRKYCKEIILVEEQDMKDAMLWFVSRHHKIAEPSGAAGIAALLSGKLSLRPEDGPVAILVTGANVDGDFFDEICADHLTKKNSEKQGQ